MIVAIQFYDGNSHKAISLVRLLADIEPAYRDDVLLGLVCQPGTNIAEAQEAASYSLEKMPTELFVSTRYPQTPKGCADLWASTVEHFADNPRGHTSICTFDGGDGVPLRKTWINDLKQEHLLTIAQGKPITGFRQGASSINLNMLMELSVWRSCSELRSRVSNPLSYETCEADLGDILIPCTRSSPIIYSEYNSYGISTSWLKFRSQRAAWSHGWKDDDLVDKARELILGKSA